jgi:hypothetical protein
MFIFSQCYVEDKFFKTVIDVVNYLCDIYGRFGDEPFIKQAYSQISEIKQGSYKRNDDLGILIQRL